MAQTWYNVSYTGHCTGHNFCYLALRYPPWPQTLQGSIRFQSRKVHSSQWRAWEEPKDHAISSRYIQIPEWLCDLSGMSNQCLMYNFYLFLGKRQCIGESLAKMNTFLAVTFLLQNFTFSKIPGVQYDLRPKPWTQLIHFPLPFKLLIEPRIVETGESWFNWYLQHYEFFNG